MKDTESVLKKYLSLMQEIRRRVEVINGMYDGTCHAKFRIVNYEVMFLQLRKILEIIVKAPILINEEEYRDLSKTPEKDWRIRDIIKRLEKANPRFYPIPVESVKRPNLPDEFKTITNGILTKEELCDAYDYCNNYLHSQNPLVQSSDTDFNREWIWIVNVVNKVRNLLNAHICHPTVDNEFFYISMENGKGYVNGNVFERNVKM